MPINSFSSPLFLSQHDLRSSLYQIGHRQRHTALTTRRRVDRNSSRIDDIVRLPHQPCSTWSSVRVTIYSDNWPWNETLPEVCSRFNLTIRGQKEQRKAFRSFAMQTTDWMASMLHAKGQGVCVVTVSTPLMTMYLVFSWQKGNPFCQHLSQEGPRTPTLKKNFESPSSWGTHSDEV